MEAQNGEKVRSLTEEHDTKMATMTEKLELLKVTFESEKV